jgi:predicted ArsR family transcriptional regulator
MIQTRIPLGTVLPLNSAMHETSDEKLLELLRLKGARSVAEIAAETEVTATAVRQRLIRLTGQGLIQRIAVKGDRGRPSHRYSLTDKARRQAGSNFADLAMVLWSEIRAVKDPDVRRGLLQRIAEALAQQYRGQISGDNLEDRMRSLKALFAERGVPFAVERSAELPVLKAMDCPYPQLAEQDRGICAVEKMAFSDLLEQPVVLSQCRLDGHSCCQFQSN